MTPNVVPFHFLLLAVGNVLKLEPTVNAQQVQDYIQNNSVFAVRPPLSECRMALELLSDSGFIMPTDERQYPAEGMYYRWRTHK